MARIRAKLTPTFRIGNIPQSELATVGHSVLEVFSTFRTFITDNLDANNQLIQEHNGAYLCDGRIFGRDEFTGNDNPYDLLYKGKADWVSFTEWEEIFNTYGYCDKFALNTETTQFRIPFIPTLQYTLNVANNSLPDLKEELTFNLVFMVQLATQYEEMSLANISETIEKLASTHIDAINSTYAETIAKLTTEGQAYLNTVAYYQDYLNGNFENLSEELSNAYSDGANRIEAATNLFEERYSRDSFLVRPQIVHIDASESVNATGKTQKVIVYEETATETLHHKVEEQIIWKKEGTTANPKYVLYPKINTVYFITNPDSSGNDKGIDNLELRDIPQTFQETLIFYKSASSSFELSFASDIEMINPDNIERNQPDTKYIISIMNGRVAMGVRQEEAGSGEPRLDANGNEVYSNGNIVRDAANPVTDSDYSTQPDVLNLLYEGENALYYDVLEMYNNYESYVSRITTLEKQPVNTSGTTDLNLYVTAFNTKLNASLTYNPLGS